MGFLLLYFKIRSDKVNPYYIIKSHEEIKQTKFKIIPENTSVGYTSLAWKLKKYIDKKIKEKVEKWNKSDLFQYLCKLLAIKQLKKEISKGA